ncbi:hypothetical protein [Streptomyces sp. cg35]|uniref:hypothetical protein n=1 Tax=Streptomyces sp. cg35 TaxID=3421650 RepID=UPI003D17C4F5
MNTRALLRALLHRFVSSVAWFLTAVAAYVLSHLVVGAAIGLLAPDAFGGESDGYGQGALYTMGTVWAVAAMCLCWTGPMFMIIASLKDLTRTARVRAVAYGLISIPVLAFLGWAPGLVFSMLLANLMTVLLLRLPRRQPPPA